MDTQNKVFVVEISSTEHDVSQIPYFFGDIWYSFIAPVQTNVTVLEPREGQPKPKEPKKVTTIAVVALIDGVSIGKVRRYFKVNKLHVFVPYKNDRDGNPGFTSTMFVPMNVLSPYIKQRIEMVKKEEKSETQELEALRAELGASLRSKLQTMVTQNFFKNQDFQIEVVIQQRKDYSTFAFINFSGVPEYDMGLASMVLSYQTWDAELAPPESYIETRFNKAKPQQGRQIKQIKQKQRVSEPLNF